MIAIGAAKYHHFVVSFPLLERHGGENVMAYATASHWVTTEWSDELEAIARNKFVPLIMGCGATGVQMIRTGEYDFTVITHYADEATATAAQEKIAAIRATAADELPMKMDSAAGGEIFASGLAAP